MLSSVLTKIQRCEELAQQKQEKMAVIEIDHEEGRKIMIVKATYLDSDEYEAFCGELIYLSGESDEG